MDLLETQKLFIIYLNVRFLRRHNTKILYLFIKVQNLLVIIFQLIQRPKLQLYIYIYIYTVCKVITSFVCKRIAQYYFLVTKNGNSKTHVQFSIGLSIEYHSHDYRMIDDVISLGFYPFSLL